MKTTIKEWRDFHNECTWQMPLQRQFPIAVRMLFSTEISWKIHDIYFLQDLLYRWFAHCVHTETFHTGSSLGWTWNVLQCSLQTHARWATTNLTHCSCRARAVRVHPRTFTQYRKCISIRQAPVFRHLHYGKAHGSLLSGWMNYNYTVCCWSNILILPSQFWQIRFESCWLHCSKCWILVLLQYLSCQQLSGVDMAWPVGVVLCPELSTKGVHVFR